MDEVRLGKNHKSSPNFAWQPLHCLRAWKNLDSITGGNYCVSETEIFTTAVTLRMKFRLVWNRSCCFLSQIWDLVVKSQCTMRNWSEKDWLENNKIIFTHSLVDVVGPFFTLSLDDLSYAWPQKDLTNGLFFIIVSCFYLLKILKQKCFWRHSSESDRNQIMWRTETGLEAEDSSLLSGRKNMQVMCVLIMTRIIL